MGHNQSRDGVTEGASPGTKLSLLLSLCDFSHPLLPSAVSSPIVGSPSLSYLCSASLLAASQPVSPWLTAPCPSTSSLHSVFRYSEYHSHPHRHPTLACLTVFPSNQLSSCVNLFLLGLLTSVCFSQSWHGSWLYFLLSDLSH